MYTFNFDPKLTKQEFYKELQTQIKVIIEGQHNWVTNLSNAASLIYFGLNSFLSKKDIGIADYTSVIVNWAGFYLVDKNKPDTLYLGPFQGKVACTMIKIGRGVCGTAAQTREAQVVPDVHLFPGHIACDSESKSEIVIPLMSTDDNKLIGVLDIDALFLETFNEEDKIGLEGICEILVKGCEWE